MNGSWLVRQPALTSTVAVAALLSLPMLLTACGGGSGGRLTHDEYQQAILEIISSEESRVAGRVYTDSVASSYETKECSARVQELHERLQSIVRQIARLRPPEDADDAQREFLAAGRESVRLVGAAADDTAMGELRCGSPLNRRIYGMPSTEKAEAAITKLEDRGYFVRGK